MQIKRGLKIDLPDLKDGELGLCLDTNELYIGNNGNTSILLSDKLVNNLTTGGINNILSAEQGKMLKEQLDEKANASDLTNGLNYKGSCLYASLPTSGMVIGDFWYCSDGDGTNGAGYYAYNGTSWCYSGTNTDLTQIESKLETILEFSPNLIDEDALTLNSIVSSTGTINASNNYNISDFIPVNNGDIITYTASNNNDYDNIGSYAKYDQNQVFLSRFEYNDGEIKHITVNWNGYIRFNIGINTENVIAVKGSTLPNYLPYGYSSAVDNTARDGIEEINDSIAEINDSIVCEGNVELDEWLDGQAYNVNYDVGTTISLEPYTSTTFIGCKIACVSGDSFTITGTGGSMTRLWCFVDSSGTILSVADTDTIETSTEHIATSDGYLIVNVCITETYNLLKKIKRYVKALTTELQSSVNDLKNTIDLIDTKALSPYYRDVDYGIIPTGYYQGLADSYSNQFTRATTYSSFITAWDTLINSHVGYVTKTTLGTASDNQSLYLYDFKPVRITNQNKPIPKIIIVAGQHGFEKSSIYGLYYFINNLLNKWIQSPILEYLRFNVEILIIPVVNTYGFDNLTYKNSNNVNINRNWGTNWTAITDTTSVDYGGTAAFDQPETQLVRDVILDNTDASLLIDFHTNGGISVTNYNDITGYGVCVNADTYYNIMLDASSYQISKMSSHYNVDYSLNQPNTTFGYLIKTSGIGILRDWATANNIVGVLVEGFNGFPSQPYFTADIFKANEEMIVNWLITTLHYLSK